jgi:RNA polymerase-binding transcription factor DksA
MSSTPLNRSQLAALSSQLDDREAQLGAEVRALNEEHAERPGREPHLQPGDAADQGEERIREAVRATEKERDITELRQIADARERMLNGSYGLCIDCGMAIPIARLQVQPFSERCVPCQEKFEARHVGGLHIPASL